MTKGMTPLNSFLQKNEIAWVPYSWHMKNVNMASSVEDKFDTYCLSDSSEKVDHIGRQKHRFSCKTCTNFSLACATATQTHQAVSSLYKYNLKQALFNSSILSTKNKKYLIDSMIRLAPHMKWDYSL